MFHVARQAWGAEPEPLGKQQNDSGFGANSMFLALIPYVVAHAVQILNIHTSLIAATALSGGVILVGLFLYFRGLRRVPLYLLDSVILVVMIMQLGVSYARKAKATIQMDFNFITNAAFAGLSLLSMIFGYPFTLQHIREAVPRNAWRHPRVSTAAHITTGIFSATFTTSTLLYLIPIAKDVWWDSKNVFTIIFMIVIPCVLFLCALIVTRLAPLSVKSLLNESEGFDALPGDGKGRRQAPVGV